EWGRAKQRKRRKTILVEIVVQILFDTSRRSYLSASWGKLGKILRNAESIERRLGCDCQGMTGLKDADARYCPSPRQKPQSRSEVLGTRQRVNVVRDQTVPAVEVVRPVTAERTVLGSRVSLTALGTGCGREIRGQVLGEGVSDLELQTMTQSLMKTGLQSVVPISPC